MRLAEDLLKCSAVLVVDDEPANVALVERILKRQGFTRVRSLTDPRRFRDAFIEQRPDLVLLDLHMPYLSGFELLATIRELVEPDAYLPTLVLTADVTAEAREQALAGGASDFLTKPFDATEVVLRVLNCLETRHLHLRLAAHASELEETVRARTRELEQAHEEAFTRMNLVSEFRDDETHEHTARVGTSAGLLALLAGEPPDRVELIEQAAPLHDIGKIGIPDAVLLKPGRLTPPELEIMRTHCTIGARIIGGATSKALAMARTIAETHHERWDGTGYPGGLRGVAIPVVGRMVTVCDVFDALTHERPYKAAWTIDRALEEIKAQRGKFFDPDLATVFVDSVVPGLPWLKGADSPGASQA